MRTPPPLADQAWRVETFQRATGAPAPTAYRYLEAEEWDVQDALASYRGDRVLLAGQAAPDASLPWPFVADHHAG